MSDAGSGTVHPAEGQLVFVPKGHSFYIFPVSNDPADDGAQIIDQAIALHHVQDLLDNNKDG